MRRRTFLQNLFGGLLAASSAPAFGSEASDRKRIVISRALYDGGPADPRPDALRRLAWEVILRTSVKLDYVFPAVRLESPELFHTPLLYLTGDAGFPAWSAAQRSNLSRYLSLGGTVLVDDAAGRTASEFDRSFRREAALLVPGVSLARLPQDHSLFRSYFLVRNVAGRVIVSPWVEGLGLGDRTPLLYCRNDLGGAWARDRLGRWTHDCVPGGEMQRQAALRLGVNVVLYALTVNYKQDQVHSPFLRGRLR